MSDPFIGERWLFIAVFSALLADSRIRPFARAEVTECKLLIAATAAFLPASTPSDLLMNGIGLDSVLTSARTTSDLGFTDDSLVVASAALMRSKVRQNPPAWILAVSRETPRYGLNSVTSRVAI